jgi:glutaredoxin
MEEITIYGTRCCPDCWRTKLFLKERGIAFHEVNIDKSEDAEELVIRVNNGRRRVPTIEFAGRYFACSPFDAEMLAEELHIPLNR